MPVEGKVNESFAVVNGDGDGEADFRREGFGAAFAVLLVVEFEVSSPCSVVFVVGCWWSRWWVE